MPFWSMLSMSPVGLSFPAGLDGGYAHSVEVSEYVLSTKPQTACILLLGIGLASHWAVVMIFENGEVFSVELLARDTQTGERWGMSDFQMRQIRLEDPWENLSEASSHQDAQDDGRGDNSTELNPANLSEARKDQDLHHDADHVGNRLHDHPRKSMYADNSQGNDVYNEVDNLEAEAAAGHAPPEKSEAVDDKMAAMCKDLRRTFRGHQFLQRRRKSRIELIEGYCRHFGYGMLCDMMWMHKQSSPAELFRRAKAVPLNGSQYDLLFHNCQLWVVMLLHDYYGIEFWKLPWTIGCLVAGPLLLIVELSFLGVYLTLSHVLPAVAIAFGMLWFGVLVWFSLLYHYRSPEGTFPFEVPLGGIILLGVPMFDRSASVANGLPFVTLVWDVVVVFQSMRQTKVFRSPFLVVWNCGTTLLALELATVAQTYYGVHAVPAVVSNVERAVGQVLRTVPSLLGPLPIIVVFVMLWALLLFGSAFCNLTCGIRDLCEEWCRQRR